MKKLITLDNGEVEIPDHVFSLLVELLRQGADEVVVYEPDRIIFMKDDKPVAEQWQGTLRIIDEKAVKIITEQVKLLYELVCSRLGLCQDC